MRHPSLVLTALFICSRIAAGDVDVSSQLLGWWQFEPHPGGNEVLEDSNREHDLALLRGELAFVPSPFGIASAVAFGGEKDPALRLEGSGAAHHWARVPASGQLTGLAAFRLDERPTGGLRQRIIGVDDAWALDVVGAHGEVQLTVHEPETTEIRTNAYLLPGREYVVLWLMADSVIARVWVYSAGGQLMEDRYATLPGDVVETDAELVIGGLPESAPSANVTLDMIAFWSRHLNGAEREFLINNGDVRRYADAAIDTDGVPDPAYRLERVTGAFDSDYRHVFLGDSFVSPGRAGRIPQAMFNVREWTNLRTITCGLHDGEETLIRTVTSSVGPENPRPINHANQQGCEYRGRATPGDRFGLPVHDAYELWADHDITEPEDGVIWRAELQNACFDDGATRRFTRAGDELSVRLLHRTASVDKLQLDRLRLTSGNQTTIARLRGGAPRQATTPMNALKVLDDMAGHPGWTVGTVDAGDLTNAGGRVANILGFTASTGRRGQHWSVLGHNSWTFSGHAINGESNGNKRYSTEQLRHWLAATTVNRDRTHLFWIHCDVEAANYGTMLSTLLALRDKIATACAAEDIGSWRLLVLIPYMHNRGALSVDGMRQANVDLRHAAHAVADLDSRVCAFSLYDATEGMLFDGSPAARNWLEEHGYRDFAYGRTAVDLVDETDGLLLDHVLVHPRGKAGATFFASLVADAIPGGLACPEDLDGDGSVGFSDLLELMTHWGTCGGCRADLTGNRDVGWDDLLAILAKWGDHDCEAADSTRIPPDTTSPNQV